MALTTQPKPIEVAFYNGLVATPILHGAEKASQTYRRGALVIDDDAGRIAETTSPVDASAVGNRCIGIALRAATGTTDADVPIAMACEGQVFEGNLMELTAGLHTLVIGDQWKVYPITKATNNWYLNADAVSDTGGALVVGFKDPLGTVDGRVYFIITTPARGGKNAGSANF